MSSRAGKVRIRRFADKGGRGQRPKLTTAESRRVRTIVRSYKLSNP